MGIVKQPPGASADLGAAVSSVLGAARNWSQPVEHSSDCVSIAFPPPPCPSPGLLRQLKILRSRQLKTTALPLGTYIPSSLCIDELFGIEMLLAGELITPQGSLFLFKLLSLLEIFL